MTILQPKVNKSKKKIKPQEYETKKVIIDLSKIPVGDKIKLAQTNMQYNVYRFGASNNNYQ
jgi:hypothetical protein